VGKKHVSAKGKAKVQAKVLFDEEGEDEPEVGEGVEATGGENGGAGPSGLGKGKGASVSAKGKGRVAGGEGDVRAAAGSQGGGRVKGVGSKGAGTEGAGPLTVKIPAPSQSSSSSKVDNVICALQAKVQRLEYDLGKELDKTEDLHRLTDEVQRLEGALRTKEERMESLAGSKERYKGMVRGLKDMHTAAMDRIRVLETAAEEAEADRRELQRKFEEVQARAGTELEELRPSVEEYLRERDDFMEWRDTGVHRMELAQELARAEDDRTRLRARMLALEREVKEYEQRKRDQEVGLEDLEEELRALGEKGEAAQACALELVQSSSGKQSFS